MDIPMIVPYIDGIKVVQVGYSYDSNDGDYIYHWGIVDPVDGETNIFYEETETNKASCLSWEIDEEHIAEGRIISRIGSNNFRVRLLAAYVKGKTYAAKVEVKKPKSSAVLATRILARTPFITLSRHLNPRPLRSPSKTGNTSLLSTARRIPAFRLMSRNLHTALAMEKTMALHGTSCRVSWWKSTADIWCCAMQKILTENRAGIWTICRRSPIKTPRRWLLEQTCWI